MTLVNLTSHSDGYRTWLSCHQCMFHESPDPRAASVERFSSGSTRVRSLSLRLLPLECEQTPPCRRYSQTRPLPPRCSEALRSFILRGLPQTATVFCLTTFSAHQRNSQLCLHSRPPDLNASRIQSRETQGSLTPKGPSIASRIMRAGIGSPMAARRNLGKG